MTIDEAMGLVKAELLRAKDLHHDFNSGHEGYAVIREEVDELWDAVKREKQFLRYDGNTSYEAVQVAAMALRFLVDLCEHDGTSAYISGRRKAAI